MTVAPGQRSLFGWGPAGIDAGAPWRRVELDPGSWVDVCRGLLRGADTVLDQLVEEVPWRRGRRPMYDRVVDDPRLSYRSERPDVVPHEALAAVRVSLERRYAVTFSPVALNFYRDGDDSVAFHGDRQLREVDDALVAVLTLGATRPFRLRPHGRRGLPSLDLAPGSGDLLVMGGACQRDWDHGVPKVRHAGPRVSVTWRWCRSR